MIRLEIKGRVEALRGYEHGGGSVVGSFVALCLTNDFNGEGECGARPFGGYEVFGRDDLLGNVFSAVAVDLVA